MTVLRPRRALVSVYDKEGVVDFCRALRELDVEIVSSGGTARLLESADVRVTAVSDYTGFPEMLDGRVKTLHPKIHGGILGLRDKEEHVAKMAEHGIVPIDLVAVNLYPFEKTVAQGSCTLAEAVEQIDIGGPCMIRAAAKNHRFVTVLTDPADYARVLGEMDRRDGDVGLDLNFELAVKAFARTSAYDAAISSWLQGRGSE